MYFSNIRQSLSKTWQLGGSAVPSPVVPQQDDDDMDDGATLDLSYDSDVDFPDNWDHPHSLIDASDGQMQPGLGAAKDADADEQPDLSRQDVLALGDIQGIPWSSIQLRREQYRATRMKKYPQFANIETRYDRLYQKDVWQVAPTDQYFEFHQNSRRITPTILHFQLRHLIKATSGSSVFVLNNNSVYRWSGVSNESRKMVDLSGSQMLDAVQVTTIHADARHLYIGGFNGELIVQSIDTGKIVHHAKVTTADNCIMNSIATVSDLHDPFVVVANNDKFVQIVDMNTFQPALQLAFNWPINHCSPSGDGRSLCAVGDDRNGSIIDRRTGQIAAKLVGHFDYSFASSWSPSGQLIATGNQDRTCRVWDTRFLKTSAKVLEGNMAAIRSVRFSAGGDFLLTSEAADFVHIYDCSNDMATCQTIDFFGEIAGMDISDDSRTVFVGVTDHVYGSLLEFSRKRVGLAPSFVL